MLVPLPIKVKGPTCAERDSCISEENSTSQNTWINSYKKKQTTGHWHSFSMYSRVDAISEKHDDDDIIEYVH